MGVFDNNPIAGVQRAWQRLSITASGLAATAGRVEATALGELSSVVHGLGDRLSLSRGQAPKGPFPSMQDLQAKFPRAGLPDRMIGTTLDNALANDPHATPDELMAKVASMGMNTVRLGAYWDEIQPNGPNSADFGKLDALLAAAQRHGVKVVLSAGAKGPNWPEFHVPAWAKPKTGAGGDAAADRAFADRAAAFVALVARHEANHPAICMWQVENEPFDPSGPEQLKLGSGLLTREAALLRQADGGRRPVMINCWSAGDRREMVDQAFGVADLVGLDVYRNTGHGTAGAYERTVGLPAYALRKAKETGKPAMIAELQADNWGGYQANAADLTTLTHQLERMGYDNMLFWRLDQTIANDRKGDTRLSEAETRLAHEATTRRGER